MALPWLQASAGKAVLLQGEKQKKLLFSDRCVNIKHVLHVRWYFFPTSVCSLGSFSHDLI